MLSDPEAGEPCHWLTTFLAALCFEQMALLLLAGLIAVRSEENDFRGAEFPEIREEEKKLFKRVVTEGYNLQVNDVSSCTTT